MGSAAGISTAEIRPGQASWPRHWQIIDGARELIVDGDPAFLLVGEGPLLVHKYTGELIDLPSRYDFDYLNTFTPVGDVPATEAE